MKKLVLILLAFTTAYSVNAQIETPQPSPSSKLEQRVGLTDITIEYSRPGVKGRKIFGGLEAFDKIWRTGANARTSITFSTDATVDGQTLEAGTYALFTKPGVETWEVYFYTDYKGGGVPQDWDDSKVVAKTTITPMELPFSIETLTFDIHNIKTCSHHFCRKRYEITKRKFSNVLYKLRNFTVSWISISYLPCCCFFYGFIKCF